MFKPAVEARFTDFSAYATYLLAALAAVAANGADPLRRFRYELSSTCSSGYDSTACTALAAKLGRPARLHDQPARGAAARIRAAPSSSGSGWTSSRSIARFGPNG